MHSSIEHRPMHIFQYLESAAKSVPYQLALEVRQHQRTYVQLFENALRFALDLTRGGLNKHDVVAAVSRDRVSLIEALYGTLAAGGTFAVLNPRWDSTYIAQALASIKPVVLVADEDHYTTATEAIRLAGVGCVLLPIWDREEDQRGCGQKCLGTDGPPSLQRVLSEIHPEDPALIIHTSATAGRPKPVVHSHRSFLAGAYQETIALGAPLTSFVTTGGLYLASATGFLVASLVARGIHVIESHEDLERYLHTIQRTRAMAARLTAALSEAPFNQYDLSSVRVWVQGAYRLGDEHMQRFLAELGPHLVISYGSTELLGICSLIPEDYRHDPEKLSTVGRPLPGVVIQIATPERTIGSETNVPGRILVRSPSQMSGYHASPGLTARQFRGEWYDTGDVGFVDGQGYLHLLGREIRDEFESVVGEAIWPGQVEWYINHHARVNDSLVVLRGGELWAFVELRKNATLTADELVAFLRRNFLGKLPQAHFPTRIVFRHRLPRDERGKICADILIQEEATHSGS
jgi:acyl-CoA synthetase (AMP-forming)/AMP-acid ligase II